MPSSPDKAAAKEKDTITIDANLLPILIAAVGPECFNTPVFKKMAELDPSGRTFNSYEKWFRKPKAEAKKILADKGYDTGEKKKDIKVPQSRKRKVDAVEVQEENGETANKKVKKESGSEDDLAF